MSKGVSPVQAPSDKVKVIGSWFIPETRTIVDLLEMAEVNYTIETNMDIFTT